MPGCCSWSRLRSWYVAGPSRRSYADRARRSSSSVPSCLRPCPQPAPPARASRSSVRRGQVPVVATRLIDRRGPDVRKGRPGPERRSVLARRGGKDPRAGCCCHGTGGRQRGGRSDCDRRRRAGRDGVGRVPGPARCRRAGRGTDAGRIPATAHSSRTDTMSRAPLRSSSVKSCSSSGPQPASAGVTCSRADIGAVPIRFCVPPCASSSATSLSSR